jgi:hypothetical protein
MVRKGKDQIRALKIQNRMLLEQITALKMAAAIEGFRIEHQGMSSRMYQGKPIELATGQLILPLPKGWIIDTTHSSGCYTIKRYGQTYAELPVIKLEG